MGDKLTTKTYWESYYSHNHADKKHITTVCGYYNDFWKTFIDSKNKASTIIEIGGFPGRYLAYLSSKFKLLPTCLDYNSDTSQIEASFRIMNVETYSVLQKDFTKYKTPQTYNYVLSNGFVEHFEDYNHILDLHVDYLAPKGRMLIMIPNMRGYIRFYKYLVDYQNLKIHNLKCMKLKVFKDFAQRHDLKVIHLGYFGGFPLGVHQKSNLFQKLIYKGHRLVFKYVANRLLLKKPSRFFSSSIITILEKQ
ncbi:methyltransferase domain-containing protein [Corallibacter sp.]|uniref:methyltransferase domain-containing protein n=1 Tax=Corallibacter sp. TaxID=2038084 RepID=UPI003AB6C6B4